MLFVILFTLESLFVASAKGFSKVLSGAPPSPTLGPNKVGVCVYRFKFGVDWFILLCMHCLMIDMFRYKVVLLAIAFAL